MTPTPQQTGGHLLTPEQLTQLRQEIFTGLQAQLYHRGQSWWALSSLLQSGGLIIAGLLIGALLTRQDVRPYPTIFDPQGALLWHGEAGQISIPESWIGTWLVEWVGWFRNQPDDLVVAGQFREKCEALATGEASKVIDAHLKATDPSRPEALQAPQRVQVRDFRIAREGAGIYRLAWQEVWTPKFAGQGQPRRFGMEATIGAEVREAQGTWPRAVLASNPRRLFITTLHWAPQEGLR